MRRRKSSNDVTVVGPCGVDDPCEAREDAASPAIQFRALAFESSQANTIWDIKNNVGGSHERGGYDLLANLIWVSLDWAATSPRSTTAWRYQDQITRPLSLYDH